MRGAVGQRRAHTPHPNPLPSSEEGRGSRNLSRPPSHATGFGFKWCRSHSLRPCRSFARQGTRMLRQVRALPAARQLLPWPRESRRRHPLQPPAGAESACVRGGDDGLPVRGRLCLLRLRHRQVLPQPECPRSAAAPRPTRVRCEPGHLATARRRRHAMGHAAGTRRAEVPGPRAFPAAPRRRSALRAELQLPPLSSPSSRPWCARAGLTAVFVCRPVSVGIPFGL